MSMLVAVTGTRQPNLNELALLRDYLLEYLDKGYDVITGGAEGTDAFAMNLVNQEWGDPARLHVVVPWVGFGSAYLHVKNLVTVFNPREHAHWIQYVQTYHAHAANLKQGSLKLLARDYGIIEPSTTVLAVPRSTISGGTAWTMGIATHLRKPCLNITAKLVKN